MGRGLGGPTGGRHPVRDVDTGSAAQRAELTRTAPQPTPGGGPGPQKPPLSPPVPKRALVRSTMAARPHWRSQIRVSDSVIFVVAAHGAPMMQLTRASHFRL